MVSNFSWICQTISIQWRDDVYYNIVYTCVSSYGFLILKSHKVWNKSDAIGPGSFKFTNALVQISGAQSTKNVIFHMGDLGWVQSRWQ